MLHTRDQRERHAPGTGFVQRCARTGRVEGEVVGVAAPDHDPVRIVEGEQVTDVLEQRVLQSLRGDRALGLIGAGEAIQRAGRGDIEVRGAVRVGTGGDRVRKMIFLRREREIRRQRVAVGSQLVDERGVDELRVAADLTAGVDPVDLVPVTTPEDTGVAVGRQIDRYVVQVPGPAVGLRGIDEVPGQELRRARWIADDVDDDVLAVGCLAEEDAGDLDPASIVLSVVGECRPFRRLDPTVGTMGQVAEIEGVGRGAAGPAAKRHRQMDGAVRAPTDPEVLARLPARPTTEADGLPTVTLAVELGGDVEGAAPFVGADREDESMSLRALQGTELLLRGHDRRLDVVLHQLGRVLDLVAGHRLVPHRSL